MVSTQAVGQARAGATSYNEKKIALRLGLGPGLLRSAQPALEPMFINTRIEERLQRLQ
jgi:hypothetical protein